MTQPPPPGYYPPGQQPIGGLPPAHGVVRPYASWGSRVGAYLLDGLLSSLVGGVPIAAGLLIAFINVETDPVTDGIVSDSVNWGGFILVVLGGLAGFLFAVWNRGVRMGTTGQSLGKQIVGIEVVSDQTGRHIGAGMGILRLILDSILGSACFLDYLWPLWDDKHQTWHDMVVTSVVLTKPRT